jgi:ABC-type nitrate/sulfonate/bicarbonate transport system substrate-binding protein
MMKSNLTRLPRVFWFSFAALACAACSRAQSSQQPAQAEDEAITLRYQGGTGVVWFPELAEDLGYLAPMQLRFIGSTISGPQDIQTVATGESDFGLAFNGAVIKLVAAHAPIRAVVGGYGVDDQTFTSFFVREDSPIRSARDLLGKQVAMNTLGAHSEFMLREFLQRQGLNDGDIKRVTMLVLPPINTEQALRAGQLEAAALTGIFRDKALERGGLRQLFSDYELYGAFTAGSYVMHRKFIEQHPKATRKFVEGVAKAIEWARVTPREEVVARATAIIAKRKRGESPEVMRYWKSTGIASTGGVIREKDLQLWLSWLIKLGELKPGQVALNDLYTNELNPYRER